MTSISDLIVTQRPLSTGAWAMYDYDEALASRFRLKDRFDEPYLLYKSGNGKLYLPRAVCPMGEKDLRYRGPDVDFDLLHPPRHDEQDRVIVETYEFLEQGHSGIVRCPTGFGKTYCAFAVTALMRVPTLVIATKDDIYEQWIEGAHKFLGLPYSKIGRIRQNTCDVAGKPFVVGMIHSLAKEGKYPEYIKKMFGLVHFDEVQRLPADEFMKVAGMFASMWRVGWSATPDRADGKQVVFQAHIGPERVSSDAVPMVPRVFRYKSQYKLPLVPRRNKDGQRVIVPLPHQHGKIGHVVSHMAKDVERNRLVAKLISMAYKDGRKVLVFSDQLEHLDTVHGLVLSLGARSSDVGTYVGGMKKTEKVAAMSKMLLFCTYGMASEGTDFVDFDFLIMISPRSDVRQIVGRVIRYAEGKKQPIVVDVIDDDSYVFQSYADKRLTFYRQLEAEVTDVFAA